MRGETRRQSIDFFYFSWECVHQVNQTFHPLHISTNDYESAVSIDLGVTDKF